MGTGPSSKMVVLYAGLLGSFQNPSVLVEIADRLRDEASLVVVGSGPLESSVREMAIERDLSNLVFLGTQPFQKMPLYYEAADVCIMTYANISFLRIGLPKKFIEYAASGKAILLVSPPCVAAEMCASWNAGYRVDADDFDGAAKWLRGLMTDGIDVQRLGEHAKRMAQKLFSVEGAVETLRGILVTPAREVVPN